MPSGRGFDIRDVQEMMERARAERDIAILKMRKHEAAKANKSKMEWSEEDRIMAATMGIRGQLMAYYKGIEPQRVARNDIDLYSAEEFRPHRYERRYNYERWDQSIRDERILFLSGQPLMRFSKSPSEVLLFDAVFDRSRQFHAIRVAIEKFLKSYLPVVEVKHLTPGKKPKGLNLGLDTEPRTDENDALKRSCPLVDTPDMDDVPANADIEAYPVDPAWEALESDLRLRQSMVWSDWAGVNTVTAPDQESVTMMEDLPF